MESWREESCSRKKEGVSKVRENQSLMGGGGEGSHGSSHRPKCVVGQGGNGENQTVAR